MEVNIGMICLQAKEQQGVPGATEALPSREEARKNSSLKLQRKHRSADTLTLDS